MLFSSESENCNQEIPEIMQALSQATGIPEAHLEIMTRERYITYIVEVQGSQYLILIQSAGSSLGNFINVLGHRFKKDFRPQGLEESATAFEVNQTKMLAHGNKKGKNPYIELLKVKT